jgi:hypothetical protein
MGEISGSHSIDILMHCVVLIGQLSCWRFPLEVSRRCSLVSGLNISGWSGVYEFPAWLQST